MITFKVILTAINTLIENEFNGIPVISSDENEGFPRPSFRTQYTNVVSTTYLKNIKREMSFAIYYFPTSIYKNKVEILDVQEKLEQLIGMSIKVNDRTLHLVEGIEFSVTDGVLLAQFDIIYYETVTVIEPSYTMQELDVN